MQNIARGKTARVYDGDDDEHESEPRDRHQERTEIAAADRQNQTRHNQDAAQEQEPFIAREVKKERAQKIGTDGETI